MWNGAGSSTWSTGANWIGGSAPAASDIAAFKGWEPLQRTAWTVTASNTYMSQTASLAADGRRNTYWWSGTAQAGGQWVRVDLGSTQTFGGIDVEEILNATDYMRGFDVYVSSDGSTWGSPIYSGTGSAQGLLQSRFSDQTARYLKIQLNTAVSNWWAISEITVWATAGDTRFSATSMTASASAAGGGAASNAIDTDLATQFSPGANQVSGQWLKIDMQASRTISAVTMDSYSNYGDYPVGYKLELSPDDSTYTQVASGSPSSDFVLVTFASQAARYLKVTLTASSGTNWWTIHDLGVYGRPSSVTTSASTTVGGFNHRSAITFTQASGHTLTVNGNWTESAGGFSGGNSPINLSGSLNLSGGTFTSTSGILAISGAFNASGGTFTHNNGRVLLSSTSNQTFATNGATFYDLAINDGLVGYWKLDETSIGTAADSSGYANNGTHANTPTLSASVPGILFADARSVSLNGTNQYISLANPSLMNVAGRITMAAWIYSTSSSGVNNVLAHGYTSSPAAETVMRVNNGTYSCASWNGTNYEAQYTIPGGDLNTWVHLACTYDGSAWNVYRNGVRVQSTAAAQGAVTVTGNWAIGARGDGSERYFHGLIDDVRLYDRTLSGSEVSALAAGNQPGTGQATQTITGAPTVANDLILASGTLAAGTNAITVTGGWNNHGGLFTSTGTVTLTAGGSEVIRSGGQPFYNLTLNGSGAIWSLENWLKVRGTLTMANGALSPGSYAVHTAVMSKTSGTLTAGTSTVVMDGSSDTTQGTGFSFNNLRIESADETGLVGYWKFDEGQGATVLDGSGTGNDGTLTSTNWTTSLPSAIGFDNHAAVSLDGTTSYGTLGATSLPAANAAQSIAVWVKTGTNSTAADRYIVSMWNGSGSGVSLGLFNTSGNLAVWKWGPNALVSTAAPSTGTWHHVAYTFDGTTHTLYLDGSSMSTSATGANTLTPTNLQIGAFNSGPGFNGSIDDLRIYSVALTPVQVKNLNAGRYSGVGSNTVVTLGANTTVTGVLTIDNGTLDSSSYTMNASSTGSAVSVGSGGTYTIGSTTQTMSGGLTVNAAGTVNLNTSGGKAAIGSGKTLAMDGTLNAGSTGATIQSASGTYTFSVGTTATATPTLNITGLAVKNTDSNGMNINVNHSASTTFTRFDNIAFSNGAGTGAGNYNLQIYATSLFLTSNGCTFDSGSSATVANNIKLTGDGTANGETRAMLGNATCASNMASCVAYASDDDANRDGVGDTPATNGAVIQWIKSAQADTAGSIEGFPTAAFDWSSFTWYSTYVAYHGASGTTDRVYARKTGGDAYYSWDVPSSGTIIGTPRWDTAGGTHYVYVATTGGRVYRLIDDTTNHTLTADTLSPWNGANNPFNCGCTIATPPAQDTNSLYFSGVASGSYKLWTVSKTSTTRQPTGSPLATGATTSNAAPAIWTSGDTYAYLGQAGRVTKLDTTSQVLTADNINPGSTNPVTGRITIISNTLYAGDDNGYMWSLDPGSNFGASSGTFKNWGYHDATNHASCGGVCQVRNHYVDPQYTRVYFGDQDGHLYAINSSGAAVTGYPWRPGTSADAFATAPLVQGGVIVIGATDGFLYVIDQSSNGSVPALIQTYRFGGSNTAVSGIAYDSNSSSYMVATANATNKDGKLYYITSSSDPTPSFP